MNLLENKLLVKVLRKVGMRLPHARGSQSLHERSVHKSPRTLLEFLVEPHFPS